MINNFFKIALRSLLKRKGYTLINILGLATGMAVCLLIILYIKSELSYDKFHKNGDNVYRVVLNRNYPGRSSSYALIPVSIGEAIQHENPEVIESTRLFNFTPDRSFFVKIGDRVFEERKVLGADSNFFRVFTGNMIEGNPSSALQNAFSAVLTETVAKKYFGSAANAIGKSFESDNETHFLVTGVCKDWPANSHFSFDLLVSNASFVRPTERGYTGFACYTYLLLNHNVAPTVLEAKFPHVIEKYAAGEIGRIFGVSLQQFQAAGNGYHYYLQPLKKIHLESNLGEGELAPNGSMKTVYVFCVIGIFILLLACINFINLSTARSVERAKEVGVRKTFGSGRSSLVFQFLLESVLVSLASILVAFLLIFLLLPLFNSIAGKNLAISSLTHPLYLLGLFVFSIGIGLVAGLYPAFVLSSFKPIVVLKGKFKSGKYGMLLRNGLVIFQFAISVMLIICTIVVNRQMLFMTGDKLGFKKDHIIEIESTDLLGPQSKAFKNELAKIPGIGNVSTSSSFPGREGFFGSVFQAIGSKEPMTGKSVVVGDQFASLLGLQLTQGRFFSKEFPTDSLAVVLTERSVQELGLKIPLGSRLTTTEDFLNGPNKEMYTYTVIGVIKDFHFQSLHQKISPLIFVSSARFGDEMGITGVRISSDHFKTAIEAVEKIWNRFVPQHPFHYEFLERTLAAQYTAEQNTETIFTIFSVFAIFIACIGLLGLAAYATQLRIREISIRKVLGASVGNIVSILSTDFLKLILLSFVIAFPLSWWAMNKWLENFAYRTTISWWIFMLAGSIAALIAMLTISFHAIKAAIMDPVKTLRSE